MEKRRYTHTCSDWFASKQLINIKLYFNLIKDMDSDKVATILWHSIWIDGPLVGVAEYKDEKVIFSRNREGKYELRRFVEGGYKKAERYHFAYRADCGGHRDHNPALYSPRIVTNDGTVTKAFDYVANGIDKIIATLEEKDFKWFHPPKKHITANFNRVNDFNPKEVEGIDMQEAETDSDDEEDS